MIEIPLFSDPFFTEEVQLENAVYKLRFRYNTAMDRWYVDISDTADVAILSGIKLVCNTVLNRFSADARNPTGALICQSQTADDSPPGRNDLGTRVKLFYATLDELNVAAALL